MGIRFTSGHASPARLRKACLLAFVIACLSGCAERAPYFRIESRFVENARHQRGPDVTETPDLRANRHLFQIVALQPPDVCADRGLAGNLGTADLKLGVLRTRCGVEMAELERALAEAGYRVASWGALQTLSKSQEVPIREAASQLRVDALFQVNALERVDIRPGRDAHWERHFYRATGTGDRAEAARVETNRRNDFERLIESREKRALQLNRIGATVNVSVVSVATGAAIWFYEGTRIEDVGPPPELSLVVDCNEEGCWPIEPDAAHAAGDGLVDGSTSPVSMSMEGDPPDESQAIFQDLVRELVTDLAERFAGLR